MALSKPKKNGEFFEPKNHVNDLILVVEGKSILHDQPHEYQGKRTTRSVATADIYCFRNSADIEAQEPSLILKDAQVTAQILATDLVRNGWMEGEAGLATIRRPGQAFVYRDDFTPEAEAAAVAWYEAREAERAAAADDMPDY